MTEQGADLPLRERIVQTHFWRASHAFDTSLPGWLVLAPTEHVLALDELPMEAAAELGPLLHSLSSALRQVVGCVKTYVMLFAEAQGYAHLHIHLVPRMPDQPDEATGPKIVRYLGVDDVDRVPTEEMDRLAASLASAMGSRDRT